jgi:hypothetical protein
MIVFKRATTTEKIQGRSNDDRVSFVESVMVSIVDSPKPTTRNAPSRRQQANHLG